MLRMAYLTFCSKMPKGDRFAVTKIRDRCYLGYSPIMINSGLLL